MTKKPKKPLTIWPPVVMTREELDAFRKQVGLKVPRKKKNAR